MLTATLEEVLWHENMNSEPKELALHSISCSDPRESLLFLSVTSQMVSGQNSLFAFSKRCRRGELEAQAAASRLQQAVPHAGRTDSPRQTQCHAA